MVQINLEMEEQIQLTTSDGVNISGSYKPALNPNNTAVLLIHQLRKDRSIWNELTDKLNEGGFSTFAIDLRGHGKSGGGSWENFSDEQFKAMINDVETAGKFLREKLPTSNIAVIGSSIGANLALNYASSSNISSAVLLSPGLNYKGITTQEAAAGFSKPLFMTASSDDPNESVAAVQRISEIVTTPQDKLKIITFQDAGHGVALFSKYPNLLEQIVGWIT